MKLKLKPIHIVADITAWHAEYGQGPFVIFDNNLHKMYGLKKYKSFTRKVG